MVLLRLLGKTMNSLIFSKLQNGFLSNKNKIIFSYQSKFLFNFLNILIQEGYIYGYKKIGSSIIVYLKYNNNKPTIQKIKAYPKNTFKKIVNLNEFKNSVYIYILTTPQGLLSHRNAIKLNTGGSLLCKII